MGSGERSRYSNLLRVGGSGDRTPTWARFSAPVQTSPGTHSAPYAMGTKSFPGQSGRGAASTAHPYLTQGLKKE